VFFRPLADKGRFMCFSAPWRTRAGREQKELKQPHPSFFPAGNLWKIIFRQEIFG